MVPKQGKSLPREAHLAVCQGRLVLLLLSSLDLFKWTRWRALPPGTGLLPQENPALPQNKA